tara:strand:- start:201 stop:605 length:405 start_codon:yes stop_codon:yes gene_type:complete
MPFAVTHDSDHDVAVLTHTGPVDEPEMRASRVALAVCAGRNACRGAIIDIRDAQIQTEPVDIIANVEGLTRDLGPMVRLAFVSREADQSVVAMIVATVAFSSGTKVGEFADLDAALNWVGNRRDTVLGNRDRSI